MKGGGKGRAKGTGRSRGGGIGSVAMQAANAQIAAAEQPILDQIQAERKANLAKAQQAMGFSKAAAAIMQGLAPRVNDIYTNAANATAGYARGLGDVVQQPVTQEVNQNNAFLQKTGAPQSALAQAPQVGGTAYGLEGYIPSSTLQREGAAFSSAAQMVPGNLLSQGQQNASSALADTSNIAPLQTDLAKLAGTRPQVYQSILSNLEDQAYKRAELGQSQQRINISAQSLQLRQAYDQASLAMRQDGLRLQNRKFGFSVQQAIAKGQQPDSALSKVYGYVVDGNGDPILGPKGQKIKVASAGKGKGGLPKVGGGLADQLGLSPNEYHEWLARGGSIAQHAWTGRDSKGNSLPRLDWKHALAQEIAAGVPRPIAIKALREQGYMPGVRGAPKISPGEGGGNPTGGMAGESPTARRILSLAQEYLGVPYVWGGESPKGFDCSGFAQYLYAKVGVQIPRTTYDQWKTGFAVPNKQLQPGDLVFFKGSDSRGGLPGHVGIYIGGGKMIDAPHTGSHVRIESVASFGGYMGARRYG